VRLFIRKACLWGFQFLDKHGMTVLQAGLCHHPKCERKDTVINPGERVIGFKSKIGEQYSTQACHAYAQFVIGS